MNKNQLITEAPKAGFTLTLVSKTWDGKRTLRSKGLFETRDAANDAKDTLRANSEKFGGRPAEYHVLGPRQLKEFLSEIKAEQTARRKEGAQKAKKTIAKEGKKFVCCPTCRAKSKKLFSEMGGLETRVCQRGHRFEYDRWLDGRAFWAPILTGQVIPESDITRPV